MNRREARRIGLAAVTVLLGTSFPVTSRAWPSPWASDSAQPIATGRWEAGLVHGVHWGPVPDVELVLHPVLFFMLPHAEGKIRWAQRGPWSWATRHRLSYPSLFLQLVSREGALGLLPATTEVPVAIEFDNDVLGSWQFAEGQIATLEAGLTTAPRLTSGEDLPLLDFPFLYPRFAALKTTFTAYAGMGVEGQLLGPIAYQVDVDVYWLRVLPGAYAVELGAWLGYRPNPRWTLLAALRIAQAKYPVGERRHVLPYFDLIFGF
jgi:hypothetical protein